MPDPGLSARLLSLRLDDWTGLETEIGKGDGEMGRKRSRLGQAGGC